jgi:hypothetical protein
MRHTIRISHSTQKNSVAWVRERTIPTERPPLVGEVSANFCEYRVPRGQHEGSLRPYSRISRPEPLLFFQVAPQLYSWGWVDPIRDPLLHRNFDSAWNRIRTSGCVARNSDHQTTEAVFLTIHANNNSNKGPREVLKCEPHWRLLLHVKWWHIFINVTCRMCNKTAPGTFLYSLFVFVEVLALRLGTWNLTQGYDILYTSLCVQHLLAYYKLQYWWLFETFVLCYEIFQVTELVELYS